MSAPRAQPLPHTAPTPGHTAFSAELSNTFLVSSQNPYPWQYELLRVPSAVSGLEIELGNAPCHGAGATWVKGSGFSNCCSPPSAGWPGLDRQLLSQILQHPHLTRAGNSRVWKGHSEPCWEKQELGQSWEGFPTIWGWDQVSSTMAALGSQVSKGQPGLCHCTPAMGSSIFQPFPCVLELIPDLCATPSCLVNAWAEQGPGTLKCSLETDAAAVL